jgi:hypothetical protein
MGAANYRLPAAPAGGFTLLGSPTIIADIATTAPESGLAARLLDVAPGETETLVARGLLRPGAGGTGFVFQLHPQAYKFEEGHVAKLELLPSDAPYSRPPNTQGPITVSNLELRLPVREQPGGIVQTPSPPVIPPGYEPAIDYKTAAPANPTAAKAPSGVAGLAKGGIRATKKFLVLRLSCAGPPCYGTLTASKGKRKLATGPYSLPGNQTQKVRVPLTKAGREFVAKRKRKGKTKSFPAKLSFSDAGRPAIFELRRPVHLKK